jgi:DNA-binding NarL/FixJ family response regulator
MPHKSITFSIVDDDAGLRDSIVLYLTVKGGLVCMGQYARAQDALANLPADPPSVVLMDIKMKGMDGIECVRRLKEKMPEILIIMLTVFEEEDLIFDALMAGATGYLLKRQPPEQLLEAIHDREPAKASGGVRMLLSARQREMLDLLAAGEPYKAIADKMGLSIHTVRGYIRRIYEKLQVHSRTEAVAKYLQR